MAGTKVLLVDDQPLQRKITRLQLEDAGYAVDTAAGALEAIDRARATRPDLILSDVLMGDIDGFGLCRRLQRDPDLAKVPVVLVSAHYGADDIEVAQAVGARTLIQRTPDFSAELAAVNEHLATVSMSRTRTSSVVGYEMHLRANAREMVRLAEQAELATERYRMMFDHARDVMSILTPDGYILDANPRWLEVLGVPPSEMIGKHINTFRADAERVIDTRDYIEGLAESGTTHIVGLRRPADGRVVYLEFSMEIVEIDGKREAMAVGRDVTAAVEARKKLGAAEEMYRNLVERIPDLVWRWRADGSCVFMSTNVEQITGLSHADVMRDGAAGWSQHIHPDDRERVWAGYESATAGGKPYEIEYRFNHPAGRTLWLRSRARTLVEDGEVYVEGLTADITERRILEMGLAQSQKMEAIGQLTGGIAHDFNNLLAVVLANSQFLLDELAANDPRRDCAQDIQDVTERARGLTKQLLMVSRREQAGAVAVDVNAVVLGQERMLHRIIGHTIALSAEVAPDLGRVRGDVGQLDQVIMNLVVNARDAMPTGGSIRLRTANVVDPAGLPPGAYVSISVADTGTGMDALTQAHVFEPFFTTKERGKGTGLGLWTSCGIVQQLGGLIQLDSELGRGTTFTILLPRHDAASV